MRLRPRPLADELLADSDICDQGLRQSLDTFPADQALLAVRARQCGRSAAVLRLEQRSGVVAAKVFLLDDDLDLRESLGALISCITSECVTAGTLAEAKAIASEVLACQLALLDINLGPGEPSGVDAYRWLLAEGFRGRIGFVTGHAASHPLVREAQALGNVSIYEKPLEMQQLVALIRPATE